ncbi:MAG TPA: aminopeptidase P N-terminal domain-containing protein [Bacteroidota bacterium]|nr:aminopeptidase P N-terminal domain-containing protein [Bacteroidota bacterium]
MNRKNFVLVLLCVSILVPARSFSQGLKYLTYDKDQTPSSEHKERRERFMHDIGADAVAVFFSATEKSRNGDNGYPFRQDDNFYYLTGFNEENAILVLNPKGVVLRDERDSTKSDTVREILFVQPRDPSMERWTGRRFGPEGAVALLGVQRAYTNEQFKKMFNSVFPYWGAKTVYIAAFPETGGELMELLQPVRECVDNLKSYNLTTELRDPSAIIKKYRVIKSPAEISLMTKAAHISAVAHRQAMMSCKPGMTEYGIQAVYEYVFRRMGSEYNAYSCIVGAAENSVILHYESNRRPINDGDIVLADCGCEYHDYASDVTRTYPANGKFSPAQRKIYQLVLDAQSACIAMMKPGTAWKDVNTTADSVLLNGLLSLGIVKEKNQHELRRFFPHGLGHAVGLDVHDVNAGMMVPGMVYTVEPGIYIPENADGVDPKFYNIGVRIEDDILITPEGHTNLSGEAPREIDEIESLMQKKGIGDAPIE